MSIFKDCDIRGIYPEELTGEESYKIGLAIGTVIGGRSIAVSGDVRVSTPDLKECLIRGLAESGAQVLDIGMNPTPVFYYAKDKTGAYAAVQVTASHNPPEYNGYKFMYGDMPIEKKDIDRLQSIVENSAYVYAMGTVEKVDGIWKSYEEDRIGRSGDMKGKVVVDAGNGVTAEMMPDLFSRKGMEVVPLFCTYDGRFPYRDPNPAVYSHLTELQKQVVANGADFGVAFDGDGDRAVFVDDIGRVVVSEQSFVLFIRDYLSKKPGSVVYDLKSSSIVKNEVERLGGTPLMERSGHAFIKRTMLQNGSVLAGEISGHFFFGEIGYDDGMYAALKMAEILTKEGKKLSWMVDTIPKTRITPDIRISVPYDGQDAVLNKVREMGQKYKNKRDRRRAC